MMRHQARPQGRARQDIELTAAGHGNEDAQPLLEENVTVHDEGPYVHPLPNASYSCDERSWGSKLVFSWINPTLEKVIIILLILRFSSVALRGEMT